MMGKVYLIGAGPGDPDLLTVKAARLLSRATIVLHDSLVSREILQLIPRDAEVIDVGKRRGKKLLTQQEINALLIASASTHHGVIRLKGGDPLMFGRAAEEIEALRVAGVDFEVVPGITAGLGAAAAAAISLTDRRVASRVLFATFSRSSETAADWSAVSGDTTLVLYMPGPDYGEVARQLVESGMRSDLPCVLVSNATTANQHIRRSTISRLADEDILPAPALLIIGRVAAQQVQELSHSFLSKQPRAYESLRSVVS